MLQKERKNFFYGLRNISVILDVYRIETNRKR